MKEREPSMKEPNKISTHGTEAPLPRKRPSMVFYGGRMQCQMCLRRFNRFDLFNFHMENHEQMKYICPERGCKQLVFLHQVFA